MQVGDQSVCGFSNAGHSIASPVATLSAIVLDMSDKPLWRLLAIIVIAMAGCEGAAVVKERAVAPSDVQLSALGQLYLRAQQKLSHPPRSVEELKPFASDVGDLNALLVSPNDKEPFVVIWGADLINSADPRLVVIYEKRGKGGVRHALTPSGMVMLTDEAFARAHFPPGHTPAEKQP
jgi:hypothetical protein